MESPIYGFSWCGSFREPATKRTAPRPSQVSWARPCSCAGSSGTSSAASNVGVLRVPRGRGALPPVLAPGPRACQRPEQAVAVHRYEFGREPRKLYLSERNRLLFVLTAYQTPDPSAARASVRRRRARHPCRRGGRGNGGEEAGRMGVVVPEPPVDRPATPAAPDRAGGVGPAAGPSLRDEARGRELPASRLAEAARRIAPGVLVSRLPVPGRLSGLHSTSESCGGRIRAQAPCQTLSARAPSGCPGGSRSWFPRRRSPDPRSAPGPAPSIARAPGRPGSRAPGGR